MRAPGVAVAVMALVALAAGAVDSKTPCAKAVPKNDDEIRLVNVVEGFIGKGTVIDVSHDAAREIASVSVSDSVFRRKAGQTLAEHREFLTSVVNLLLERIGKLLGAFSGFTLDLADDRQALLTVSAGGGLGTRTTFHGGPIRGCRR